MNRIYLFLLLNFCVHACSFGQTYMPVTVSGFNQDPFAESGTNAVATTSASLDGTNHIMYTAQFGSNVGITNGVVNNGTIVFGSRTFQLASYTANNALSIKRGEVKSLLLSSPAAYGNVSLLVFSTEGNSLMNISFGFTDGTSTTYLSNYNMLDWFNGTVNIAYQNFARTTRITAPPYTADGLPSNPRFYYVDVNLSCSDRLKSLQSITFSNVTTAGTNAPYPNAIALAVSGAVFQQTIITSSTAASCSGPGGTASVVVSGSTGPYSYSWNTVPVQTSATATNLAPGTYTVTITDASFCVRTATVVVTGSISPAVPVTSGVTVCNGANATLQIQNPIVGITYNWYTTAAGGVPAGTGTSFTVNNVTSSTTYYVEAFSNGCSSARAPALITALPVVATPTATGGTICSGSTGTVQVTNPIAGVTYNWYTSLVSGTLVGGGAVLSVPGITSTTTFYVEATSNGCISASRAAATVTILGVLAAPVVTLTNATASSLTFSWSPVPGATGYLVSTDGTTFQVPSTGSTGTSHTITGLAPLTTITISVKALGTLTCQTSALGSAKGQTLTNEIFVPNAFTPNGDGKNDVLLVYGNTIASMDLVIFDQWGELIFESTNQAKGWDGIYKGKPQPVGVYVYVLKAVRTDGTSVTKKGSINLIR